MESVRQVPVAELVVSVCLSRRAYRQAHEWQAHRMGQRLSSRVDRPAAAFRGQSRRYTIGVHGSPWTLDQARSEAKRVLGLAASGNDPAALKQGERAALTVGELCNLYLAEGCATKKASTIATDRGRIGRHIKPLLGRTRIVDISRADIERFFAGCGRR